MSLAFQNILIEDLRQVTKQGAMKHRDSAGNEGIIHDGGVLMTAGRGIIHSEMPQQTEGLLWGYQPG